MHDIRDQIRASRPEPDEVTPLDVEALAERARRGTVALRSAVAVAAVVALAGAGLIVSVALPMTVVDIAPLGPDPVGTAADLPQDSAGGGKGDGSGESWEELAPKPPPVPERPSAEAESPPEPDSVPEPQTTPVGPEPAEPITRPLLLHITDYRHDDGVWNVTAEDFEIWIDGYGSCRVHAGPGERPCEGPFGEFVVGEVYTDGIIIYPDGPSGIAFPVTFWMHDEMRWTDGQSQNLLIIFLEGNDLDVMDDGGWIDVGYWWRWDRTTGELLRQWPKPPAPGG